MAVTWQRADLFTKAVLNCEIDAPAAYC